MAMEIPDEAELRTFWPDKLMWLFMLVGRSIHGAEAEATGVRAMLGSDLREEDQLTISTLV